MADAMDAAAIPSPTEAVSMTIESHRRRMKIIRRHHLTAPQKIDRRRTLPSSLTQPVAQPVS